MSELHKPDKSKFCNVVKIGVLSDTHIPQAAQDIPQAVYKEFETVDLILHAGDIVELAFLENLKKIAPVRAVRGNMDTREISSALPDKDIVSINNKFKIGLIHGRGAPRSLMAFVQTQFDNVDAIVFGHSHSPVNEIHDGILLFNPGTPTDKIFAPYNSFGILEVNNSIKGRIIKL